MIVRDAFGAKLHSSIYEPFRAFQFPLHGEFEIRILLRGGEEFISGLLLLKTARRDGAVLNPPGGLRVSFPARERLAVEKRLRFRFPAANGCEEDKSGQENGRSTHMVITKTIP